MNDIKMLFRVTRELRLLCDKLEPRNPLENDIRTLFHDMMKYINDNHYRDWVNEADFLRKVEEHQMVLPLYNHTESYE